MSRFTDALNEQIAYEFGASQQYIAIAVVLRRADAPTACRPFLPPGGGGAESRDDDGAVPPRRRRGRRDPGSRGASGVVLRRCGAGPARARAGEARDGTDPAARADGARRGRPRRGAVHALVPEGTARRGLVDVVAARRRLALEGSTSCTSRTSSRARRSATGASRRVPPAAGGALAPSSNALQSLAWPHHRKGH